MVKFRQIVACALVSSVLMLQAQEVTLISSDGKELVIPRALAQQFQTINALLQDTQPGQPIPLTAEISSAAQEQLSITGTVLETIIKAAQILTVITDQVPSQELFGRSITSIGELIIHTELPELCQLLKVVNYVDHPQLLNVLAYSIATELNPATKHTIEGVSTALKEQHLPKELIVLILVYYNLDGLDYTFGIKGKAVTPGSIPASSMEPQYIGSASDGTVVTAGTSTHDFDSAITYNADGAVKDYHTDQEEPYPAAWALQGDGKLLSAGKTTHLLESQGTLKRYTRDHKPDATFGLKGTVTVPHVTPESTDEIAALAIDLMGNILLAGTTQTFSLDDGVCSQATLARYMGNGARDTHFGIQGHIVLPGANIFLALALQKDGKIIAVGIQTTVGLHNFLVARFNPQGTLDTTFNGTGYGVTLPFESLEHSAARQAIVQPDGKILIIGQFSPYDVKSDTYALARYTSDGLLDTTFGNYGCVMNIELDTYWSGVRVALQQNGSIILVGNLKKKGCTHSHGVIIRFTAQGKSDKTFGQKEGYVLLPGGDSSAKCNLVPDTTHDLLIQPNGDILILVRTYTSDQALCALMRYTTKSLRQRLLYALAESKKI